MESDRMKRIKIILFLIILPILLNGQSSLKLDSIQLNNFRSADLVFLGEVIEIDTFKLTCKMKEYEIFKGQSSEIVNFIITSGYTFIPEPAGLWIIYANKVSDAVYTVSDKSISRSNLNPDRIYYYLPKPPKRKEDRHDYSIKAINRKINALTEWNNELYKLRSKQIK
jgi:hypothetical protein